MEEVSTLFKNNQIVLHHYKWFVGETLKSEHQSCKN